MNLKGDRSLTVWQMPYVVVSLYICFTHLPTQFFSINVTIGTFHIGDVRKPTTPSKTNSQSVIVKAGIESENAENMKDLQIIFDSIVV